MISIHDCLFNISGALHIYFENGYPYEGIPRPENTYTDAKTARIMLLFLKANEKALNARDFVFLGLIQDRYTLWKRNSPENANAIIELINYLKVLIPRVSDIRSTPKGVLRPIQFERPFYPDFPGLEIGENSIFKEIVPAFQLPIPQPAPAPSLTQITIPKEIAARTAKNLAPLPAFNFTSFKPGPLPTSPFQFKFPSTQPSATAQTSASSTEPVFKIPNLFIKTTNALTLMAKAVAEKDTETFTKCEEFIKEYFAKCAISRFSPYHLRRAKNEENADYIQKLDLKAIALVADKLRLKGVKVELLTEGRVKLTLKSAPSFELYMLLHDLNEHIYFEVVMHSKEMIFYRDLLMNFTRFYAIQ